MSNSFQIVGYNLDEFSELFSLNDEQLRERGAWRIVADKNPGIPCRVSLMDAEIGERVIAISHEHHAADSPYRGSGPIFIRENAIEPDLGPNELPKMLTSRLLSVRAYDSEGMMCAAEVVQGSELKNHLLAVYADKKVAYIHIHNARPGCYNCRAERV